MRTHPKRFLIGACATRQAWLQGPWQRVLYVYLHLDDQGEPFYAGRGRGATAWEVNGGPAWEWFVRERLGGCYHVLVLAKDLTEEGSAQTLEELLTAYGPRLLNAANYHRGMNYPALEENGRLRKQLRPHYDQIGKIADPNERLAMARHAIAIQSSMNDLDTEQGRFGEVLRDMGALCAMDNVFITHAVESLMEQGRVDEAKAELATFVAKMHPARADAPRIERLRKMVERGTFKRRPKKSPAE